MEKIQIIEHKEKRILFEDFSRVNQIQELRELMATASEMIHSQPEKSVLALVDVTGVYINKDILDIIKEFACGNTPYMKAVAVLGVQGFISVGVQTVARSTGREFHTFDNIEAAKDWLVVQ